MPSPNKRFNDIGMWERYDAPTPAGYEVLLHLATCPGSRLIIYNDYYAGLTNCEVTGAPGKSVRGKLGSLEYGALAQRTTGTPGKGDVLASWVVPDNKSKLKLSNNTQVYKITKHGLEAIAQYEARARFEAASLRLAARLLAAARRRARTLTPK